MSTFYVKQLYHIIYKYYRLKCKSNHNLQVWSSVAQVWAHVLIIVQFHIIEPRVSVMETQVNHWT